MYGSDSGKNIFRSFHPGAKKGDKERMLEETIEAFYMRDEAIQVFRLGEGDLGDSLLS